MPESTAVEIPLVNVNDGTVKLTAWLVKDGEEVREGQKLAEIETSKALVELAASVGGKIHIRVAAGVELTVGTIIAYIGTNGPVSDLRQQLAFRNTPVTEVNEPLPASSMPGTRFSKKALELLLDRGIAINAFEGIPMVREQDVQEYLKRLTISTTTPELLHFALKGISLEGVSLPSQMEETNCGRLDPAFLNTLRKNPDAISNLSSADKCKAYREGGAQIGDEVFIGPGTILIAPQIHLGDRVHLGPNCGLVVRERLAISTLSSFREGLVVRGGTVIFGQNTFAGSRIQIGGGGNSDPWAVFIAGDNVYLGDDLFVNICRPVVIGKEVFLTQRTVVVTHNIGHSILEGYENTFAPVVLEDFAQIGMNSTLYAGSRVGEGAIVASNSYVISSIPKGKLAIGVPAHVVRDAVRPLTRQKQLQIVHTMVGEFHELLELKGVQVSPIVSVPFVQFTAEHEGKKYKLGFLESYNAQALSQSGADETVLWTFDSEGRTPSNGLTLINVLTKSLQGPSGLFVDSNREFLRKRGIRLQPGPWRYRKGLI